MDNRDSNSNRRRILSCVILFRDERSTHMTNILEIEAITVHFPDQSLTNHDLVLLGMSRTVDEVEQKTGISNRHIATNETSLDLAEQACNKLFELVPEARSDIDFILFCTQTPDYFLPSCSCLLQNRLNLSTNIGALDISMGCSGFVYILGVAAGLLNTGQATRILAITADTYSHYLNDNDHSVRTLFGDGAAAVLIGNQNSTSRIGPFVNGTDGSGSHDLIVENGAHRELANSGTISQPRIAMKGPSVFNFAMQTVPKCLDRLFDKAQLSSDEIDYLVLHQANRFMLNNLFDKMKIKEQQQVVEMENCGNTVSSSIPIALARAVSNGTIKDGCRLAYIGFGVGLSWAGTIHSGFTRPKIHMSH